MACCGTAIWSEISLVLWQESQKSNALSFCFSFSSLMVLESSAIYHRRLEKTYTKIIEIA